jgi:phosphohistidine phosphatase
VKLWVARHSFAGAFLPYDPKGERERDLRPKGVEMADAIAAAMKAADEIPNVIFASPLERAKQTADIIGAALAVQVNIIDDLAPNRPIEDRLLELMGHTEIKRIMVVGHHDNLEPAFQNFGGDFDPIAMGEVRRLKIDRRTGAWKEKWRVAPSDLGFQDMGVKR